MYAACEDEVRSSMKWHVVGSHYTMRSFLLLENLQTFEREKPSKLELWSTNLRLCPKVVEKAPDRAHRGLTNGSHPIVKEGRSSPPHPPLPSPLPMAKAVSRASPVIIFTDTPDSERTCTASFTPARGGSMIPTRPRNVSFPSSGPEARASTEGRQKHHWGPRTDFIPRQLPTPHVPDPLL